jgi:hypothetical protein
MISGIPSLMPRKFRVNRKFWVAFGLLTISLRIFTGAPGAQVNFSTLFTSSYSGPAQNAGQKIVEHSVHNLSLVSPVLNSESHEKHVNSSYKKYISPENFLLVLVHKTQKPEVRATPRGFVNFFDEIDSVYRPTSHSPPAVVSAHLPTHTTTAVNSATLEKHDGEISINNSAREFRSL